MALLLSTAVANKAGMTSGCWDRGTGVVHWHGKGRSQGAEKWRHMGTSPSNISSIASITAGNLFGFKAMIGKP